MMQSFPFKVADRASVLVTVVLQSESLKAAFALGAVTIEIAESVETAKTKGINEATKRRALRMKSARLTAIPIYSFTGAAGKCLFLNSNCLNKWNIIPLNSPQPSKNERGGWDSRHTFCFQKSLNSKPLL
jgi:hypothetical protein